MQKTPLFLFLTLFQFGVGFVCNVLVFLFSLSNTPHLCLFTARFVCCDVCVGHPVCVGVCAQLTIEKDKLKEAQRLIWESEAKVGFYYLCMRTSSKPHLQSNDLHNQVLYQIVFL